MGNQARPAQQDAVQPLIKVKDVAAYLAKTPSAVYTMAGRREIPFRKLGRCLRFDMAEIRAWADAQRVEVLDLRATS